MRCGHAQLCPRTFEGFRDLVEFILEDGLDLASFATTAWMIWHRRNALRTTSKPFPIQQVLPEVRAVRAAYVRSIPPKPPHPPFRAPERIIWKPPPWPRHKVNFDGAVFREDDSAGVGAVIRDEKGFMVAAMAEKIPLPYSITALEALAAIRALRLAGDIGLESFILEGDSKITIDALAENFVEHAEFGNLFEEAKWLASQFGDVSFNHVRRQGNGAAHNCARHARHVSEYTVWMEDIPPHLFTVIQAELASFE
ncbi:uncharacterized protein LOC126696677 [Quercus robur]|uniref:uncharacterized protein LOC126696677 n=1 Tax=Quercus robur TaxID=38942 RepID=UPI002161F78D|nr:uncharacterized protein LOC126696677 [Quercus robur]